MKLCMGRFTGVLFALGFIFSLAGCKDRESYQEAVSGQSGSSNEHKGEIVIDGSSTVFVVSRAIAEGFSIKHPDMSIPVSQSGTGGGFKKFIAGEIDICDASRPISKEEDAALKAAGQEYIELPIAFDGVSVIVNNSNDFATDLTVEELKKIWAPGSQINNWKDVRPGFPDLKLKLFGPGTDSGTFEYFSEAIVGKKNASRSDFTNSEEDNIILNGVQDNKGALGYLGYAYYRENTNNVKAVKVNGVAPTEETVRNGSYNPLSRPLFIYVRKSALDRPEVKAFVEYYLSPEGREMIGKYYIKFPDSAYEVIAKHAKEMRAGTHFQDYKPGMTIEQVLAKEGSE
jgi:phosphate transport system substrate-binding protein